VIPAPSACIGVFDSGLGGLTVLRAISLAAPEAPLAYLADTAHAPYGERSAGFIIERSLAIAEHLFTERRASILVVACNTATAHAIQVLRARWPDKPIVGIEPGIKPAVAATQNGRIGVLATPATVASERYQTLLKRHAEHVHVISQPCPGLVDLIETGALDGAGLREQVERCCAPLRAAGVDTVLMGCTHYPLIQPLLQSALGPQVQLLNIESAVAKRAATLWRQAEGRPSGTPGQAGRITLAATGRSDVLQALAPLALGSRPLQLPGEQLAV
jgi:glutamate racemase